MEMSGQPHTPAVLHPEKTPGTHWVGDWLGPRAGLDAKRKNPAPAGDLKPVVQLQPSHHTDWATFIFYLISDLCIKN
jgi:hypothetical protein